MRLAEGPLWPLVAGRAGRLGRQSSRIPTPRKADAAMTALFGMKKVDVAAIQAAVDAA